MMDSELQLKIREIHSDMKNNKFIIVGAGEFLGINNAIRREDLFSKILKSLLFLFGVLLTFSIVLIGRINIIVALALYCLAIYLMMMKEQKILEDLHAIEESDAGEVGDTDYLIFIKDKSLAQRARKMLEDAIKGEIEGHDILIMYSAKLIVLEMALDTLILFGTLLLMYSFAYISVLSFIVLGAILLWAIFEIMGKIIDILAAM